MDSSFSQKKDARLQTSPVTAASSRVPHPPEETADVAFHLDDTTPEEVPEPQPSDQPLSSREHLCRFCGKKAMYTCPGCQFRSCSLECSKRHKSAYNCSGMRSTTESVPLSEFDDSQLRRDFRFIDDCKRVVENSKRGFTHLWRYSYQALPPPLFALRDAAKRRGVICQFISEGMKNRTINTSRYDRKSDTIIWHLQLSFHGNDRPFTVRTSWANERFKLGDIIAFAWATNPRLEANFIHRGYNSASKWVSTSSSETAASEALSDNQTETPTNATKAAENAPGSPSVATNDTGVVNLFDTPSQTQLIDRERIETYLHEHPDYMVLSHVERIPGPPSFFKLDPSETLHDNLRTLFFVSEFPNLLVVPANAPGYPILSEANRIAFRETFRKRARPPPEKPANSDDNLRMNTIPCREFSHSGTCSRKVCHYWHCPPEELPVCRNLLRDGTCSLGDRCSFRHTTAKKC